jgi:hypothetical protein
MKVLILLRNKHVIQKPSETLSTIIIYLTWKKLKVKQVKHFFVVQVSFTSINNTSLCRDDTCLNDNKASGLLFTGFRVHVF